MTMLKCLNGMRVLMILSFIGAMTSITSIAADGTRQVAHFRLTLVYLTLTTLIQRLVIWF